MSKKIYFKLSLPLVRSRWFFDLFFKHFIFFFSCVVASHF